MICLFFWVVVFLVFFWFVEGLLFVWSLNVEILEGWDRDLFGDDDILLCEEVVVCVVWVLLKFFLI